MPEVTTGGPVRGRFAPTPSGRMHLGNVFSALMAWLAVRSVGGNDLLTTRVDVATEDGEPVCSATSMLVARGTA